MFILRQVFSDHTIQNLCIGGRYRIVYRDLTPKEFKVALGVTDSHPDHKDIFAVLEYDNGSLDNYPLYKNSTYYIMTSSGKTFERIHN